MADIADEGDILEQIDAELAASGVPAVSDEASATAAAEAAAAESARAAEAETARVADEQAAGTKTAEELAAEQATADEAARVAAEAAASASDENEGRYRLKGKLAAVAQLTKTGVSEAEAIRRVYGELPAAEPEATPEPKIDPLEALRTELTTITGELDQAAQDETLFTADVRKKMQREAELRDQIREGEVQRKEAQTRQVQTDDERFISGWNTSEAWVAERYPDALVKDSDLNKAVAKRMTEIGENPEHPLFGLADLPKTLYAQEAAELGIAPKTVKAAPTPPVPVQKGMPPASGAAKGTPPPVNNEATVKAQFQAREAKARDDGDDEELYRLAEEELGSANPREFASGSAHIR